MEAHHILSMIVRNKVLVLRTHKFFSYFLLFCLKNKKLIFFVRKIEIDIKSSICMQLVRDLRKTS